jgi:hypothetical protein
MSDLPVASNPNAQVPTDLITILARTQAITKATVAEGLYFWTDAKMKHRSKDWPIFNGQVFNYIAWKHEWKMHHLKNYPGLKGDSLRRVLVECCFS